MSIKQQNPEERIKSKLSELLEYHTFEFLDSVIKDVRMKMVDKNEDEITIKVIEKLNSLKKRGINSKYKTKNKKSKCLSDPEQENLKEERIKLNTLYEASKTISSLRSITTGMHD